MTFIDAANDKETGKKNFTDFFSLNKSIQLISYMYLCKKKKWINKMITWDQELFSLYKWSM